MRVRPTELGWKGLALVGALGVAFFATSYSNLFFLVIAFSLVIGLFGCAGALRNVAGVRVVSVAVPFAAAGHSREVALQLASRRRAFDVRVSLDLGGRVVDVAHAAVLHGEVRLGGAVQGLSRGIVHVARARVATSFPFGLFRVVREVPVGAEFVTHPAPGSSGARLVARCGEHALAGAARSVTAASLRELRAGDETRDVHWKATARRGEPVVREWEHEGGDELEIVLDRRCSTEVLEQALADATGAALAALSAGRAVTLRSQEAVLRAAGGRGDRESLLRWLAAAGPVGDGAPSPARRGAAAILLPGSHGDRRA